MIDAALMRMAERLAAVEAELERRRVEVPLGSQLADDPIINGGMDIWQRGTTFAAMSDQTYGPDRWCYGKVASSTSQTFSRGTPPAISEVMPGANYALTLTTNTADTSIATGDLVYVFQRIEGYHWYPFSQKDFTVGFWVYATVTGTYCVSARSSTGDRSCVVEYTVTASNTWEYKTVTFPASPSAGTWDYTNNTGLHLAWAQAAGSSFHATPGSWVSSNSLATSNQVNSLGTVGNIFQLWGVRMGFGLTVAPYWPRSWTIEHLLSQRYYWKSFPYATAPAQNAGTAGGIACAYISGQLGVASVHFPVPMRASPTVTTYNPSAANTNWSGGSTASVFDAADSGFHIQSFGGASTSRDIIHATAAAEL